MNYFYFYLFKKNIIYNEIYNQSRNLPLTHYFKKLVHDSFQTRGWRAAPLSPRPWNYADILRKQSNIKAIVPEIYVHV